MISRPAPLYTARSAPRIALMYFGPYLSVYEKIAERGMYSRCVAVVYLKN
jgi:hypothetical protein